MKRKIVLPIAYYVSYLILFVGVALFAFGSVVLGKGIYNKNNTSPVEAKVMTVIENDDERYILITYTVEGKQYNAELPYFDGTLDIGDKVTVYYYNDNPQEINGSDKYLLQSIILILCGLCIIIYKGLFLIKYFKEKKRIELLKKRNRCELLEIICVEEIEKEICYGVVPKVIICVLGDKEIKSSFIWESYKLDALVGHKVKVYYEDSSYKNYYVDYTEVE